MFSYQPFLTLSALDFVFSSTRSKTDLFGNDPFFFFLKYKGVLLTNESKRCQRHEGDSLLLLLTRFVIGWSLGRTVTHPRQRHSSAAVQQRA